MSFKSKKQFNMKIFYVIVLHIGYLKQKQSNTKELWLVLFIFARFIFYINKEMVYTF